MSTLGHQAVVVDSALNDPETKREPLDYPDGGRRAWLVLLGVYAFLSSK
jgi:hypothetical protein